MRKADTCPSSVHGEQLSGIFLLPSFTFFTPLHELETIGTERIDLIIKYSSLPSTLPDATVYKSFSSTHFNAKLFKKVYSLEFCQF